MTLNFPELKTIKMECKKSFIPSDLIIIIIKKNSLFEETLSRCKEIGKQFLFLKRPSKKILCFQNSISSKTTKIKNTHKKDNLLEELWTTPSTYIFYSLV